MLPVDVRTAATAAPLAARPRARADGVLTLNTDAAAAGLGAAAPGREASGSDLRPLARVLEAVRAGRMRFAVDQQAYLQGYLPIVLLAQRIRYGLFPGEGEVVPTGPTFVTRATAPRVMQLSRRGIR